MVVGNVQSGKTTHYTTLAAKALDAGYQIVIILAGIHSSLRSQTHERIDQQLIGRDSAALVEARRTKRDESRVGLIGVGLESFQRGDPQPPFTILTCTSSSEQGDFKTEVATQVGLQPSPGSRLVMVVKKNARILRNLIHWLRTQNTLPGVGGNDRRIGAPALVIDDEADHASVNTGHDIDADPTTINRLIRQLLRSFDRVGFVGYTATPFANIFISNNADHDTYGPDLFPRSFIVNLKAPSNYLGPKEVFGHPGDESVNIPMQEPLPMHVGVTDASNWIPDKHKKDCVPGPMPASLKEAIRLFVLNCATRACRGDVNVHNSMLVHVTRFVDVQSRVAVQVEAELTSLKNVIGLGADVNRSTIEHEMKEIWLRQVVEQHDVFRTALRERVGEHIPNLPSWSEVWLQVTSVLNRVQVMRISGTSGDALAYSGSPDGLYVIAIGGDKLSRGLTLEGLSVSYFLRASAMFDTLMQMGRWFGYRPRYTDLCRVYTTPYLYGAFREIALAMEELRSELDLMETIRATPEDFGLRVRTPSDGLLITARNKIRRGEEVEVRFAGELVQALSIPRGEDGQAAVNRAAAIELIERLGKARRDVRGREVAHFIWSGVDVGTVLDFLAQYEAFSTPSFFKRCDPLHRYIREQNGKGELVEWTVAVVSKREESEGTVKVGPYRIPLIKRTSESDPHENQFRIKMLSGRADECIDLDDHEFQKAQSESRKTDSGELPSVPDRLLSRCARPDCRGLLLLYLIRDPQTDENQFIPAPAISFPDSRTAKPLSYTVNDVWQQQYGLLWDDPE